MTGAAATSRHQGRAPRVTKVIDPPPPIAAMNHYMPSQRAGEIRFHGRPA